MYVQRYEKTPEKQAKLRRFSKQLNSNYSLFIANSFSPIKLKKRNIPLKNPEIIPSKTISTMIFINISKIIIYF